MDIYFCYPVNQNILSIARVFRNNSVIKSGFSCKWENKPRENICCVFPSRKWDLWEVIREYGVGRPLLRAVRSLYNRSRSLVHTVGSKSDLFLVHVGLRQCCGLSLVLFIIFMDRLFRCSQGLEGVWFGSHWISSLLFADDVVLLALSSQDLQHVLGWFAAECEAAWMKISNSKSEAMVLDWKKVAWSLRIGGEFLPQVEEFEYLGVLFMSEGRMERETDRRNGAAVCHGEKRADPHLWSWTLGCDQGCYYR